MLDDQDVFTTEEEDQIAHIKTTYKTLRIAIITAAAVFCTIEILLTLKIIVEHWK